MQLGTVHAAPMDRLTQWNTLGTILRCGSLKYLTIRGSDASDEGVALLAAGLRRSGLPLLESLELREAQIGPRGASDLASAFTAKGPNLKLIDLQDNNIGDLGLCTLAPALRRLSRLNWINLDKNQITDRGLGHLLASTEGALNSLERLFLGHNRINDDGCTALVSVLRSGRLLALTHVGLQGNPASAQAKEDVKHARGELDVLM